MKLVIISHTRHYIEDGQILGWGPTLNEINHLLDVFEKIYHIAVLIKNQAPPPSSIPYSSNRIEFVPIPASGGTNLLKKINIFFSMPATIKTVKKFIDKADCYQFRSPTGIGVYLLPYLSYFIKKPGWFKYAGNWKQLNPPIGYRFQKYFLKNLQKNKVTVNGYWPDDPVHITTFENPCLEEEDRFNGHSVIRKKSYDFPLTFCFAGSFGKGKGEQLFLEAINEQVDKSYIDKIHFLGDGDNSILLKKLAKDIDVDILFHGFVNRKRLFNIFSKSHFIVLPSQSEGFPKVIAEASNFGCIPIVSNVGSISQYIKDQENGFLWQSEKMNFLSFFNLFSKSIYSYRKNLKKMAVKAHEFSSKFTYNMYNSSLNDKILKEIL